MCFGTAIVTVVVEGFFSGGITCDAEAGERADENDEWGGFHGVFV